MRIAGVGLLVLGGCRCVAPPEEPSAHVPGFGPLVEAIARDDVAAALQWSEGLIADDDEDDGGASVTIGASLGFLRVSDIGEERAMALARLSVGCGECHLARDVSVPPSPSFTHHTGAHWALDALVWSRPLHAPDTTLRAVSEAVVGADSVEDATRLIEACQSCHAPAD